MAYTPPHGSGVTIFFSGDPYSPPPGSSTTLDFTPPAATTIYPAAIASLSFGNVVCYWSQPLHPSAWSQLVLGTPTVRNRNQFVTTTGFFAEDFGATSIARAPDRQRLTRVGGSSFAAFGTPFVAFNLRYITNNADLLPTAYGTPFVAYRVRYIEVPWTSFTQWGRPAVGRKLHFEPLGADSSRYGTPAVDWLNVPRPRGWNSSVFGAPWVSRSPRQLRALPLEAVGFGSARVYASRQYIVQLYDPEAPVTTFGARTWVYNRNRSVGPFGWNSQKISYYFTIQNTARAIVVSSRAHTQWGAGTFVSHRIRTVQPSGAAVTFLGRGTAVHNAARVLAPLGFAATTFGRPNPVFSNLQRIRQHSGAQPVFGTQFVAYRIRTIVQRPTRELWGYGQPAVALRTNYVAPLSWDSSRLPPPVLVGPIRRTITPRWTLRENFGTGRVWNKTPQIYPRTPAQTSYGKPWVSFRVRYINDVRLGVQTSYGRPDVRDRRQYVTQFGADSLQMPRTARVALENPYLPFVQFIEPPGFGPTYVPAQQVQSSPFPVGWDSSVFSRETWVRMQGCMPRWDWPDSLFRFGTPSLNATQWVRPDTTRTGVYVEWGKPRLSPYTVWCRFDTPEQARDNHPGYGWRAVDSYTAYGDHLPPWFGTARVYTPSPQVVAPPTLNSWSAGTPWVSLWRRYLAVTGVDSKRFGYPLLPGPRRIWAGKIVFTEFGDARVGIAPLSTQWLRVTGTDSFAAGALFIENKNRSFAPQGFVATQYGNNDPMVYHYPRGFSGAGALDATQWGTTWASHHTREVAPEGFDAFSEGYTFGYFNQRLRIYLRTTHAAPSVGDSSRFGAPGARLSVIRIRPYMIPNPKLCPPPVISRGN